ncbi:MAG: prepilin-type N-terminal cleavage/methylation domain-containing protein [Planctomycetes bacterium]|nr:prepilin-type N-terminal cleavage/methylation domain-containing protein [Planctomycetota bacterium]
MRRCAFTIIELLVVIAIIAVLAAILLPSLWRARHLAMLTQCGANMHQIHVGLVCYAGDAFGNYPYLTVEMDSPNPKRTKLRYDYPPLGTWDDRPRLRPYIAMSQFHCPGAPGTSEQIDRLDVTNARDVHGSYEMYFGSRLLRTDPTSATARLNDPPARYNGRQFSVLLADMDWEVLNVSRRYNHNAIEDPDGENYSDVPTHYALWYGTPYNNDSTRGRIDRNFLLTDGAVRLVNDLQMADGRLVKIYFSNCHPEWTEYGYLLPR